MKHEITTAWAGGMAFESDIFGHKLRMDSSKEGGGEDSGCRPKPLLLASVAGCSGMDVVSILNKMRQALSWFDIKVEAEATEGQPSYYSSMEMVYRFKESDKLDEDKVKRAVELSHEKYCGVSALFKMAIPVTWRIEYC
ncbi:MAG TPA: OsmC family protein [Rectinemataceae bacterium]|nr:OsmC family protein [Rectinemataceae bacterium]